MDYEVCEQTYRKQFGLQEHIPVDVWHVLPAQRDKRWLLSAVVFTECGGRCKIGLHASQVELKIILHVICNYEWR